MIDAFVCTVFPVSPSFGLQFAFIVIQLLERLLLVLLVFTNTRGVLVNFCARVRTCVIQYHHRCLHCLRLFGLANAACMCSCAMHDRTSPIRM